MKVVNFSESGFPWKMKLEMVTGCDHIMVGLMNPAVGIKQDRDIIGSPVDGDAKFLIINM